MKALFITLLIFGGAFTAYDYFLAPPGQKMIFKKLNEGAVAAEPASGTPATTESGIPVPPIPQDKAAPAMKTDDSPPPALKPATTVSDAPPPPVADPTAFAVPKFEPLESLAKNWTFIPKTAFPRQVHLKKAVPFKMSVGSSFLNAGAEVVALGFENGNLTLAPTASSTARAIAPLDDTDLKAILYENYEKWKVLRVEFLKKAHERRLANKSTQPPESAPTGDASQAPSRSGDGSYPLLVSHLNSGDVTEIKAKNIHNWGDPVAMQYEGKPAWGIKVQADVDTVFGLQPAEAQAIVSGGRVKGWFYTGSGEPVP